MFTDFIVPNIFYSKFLGQVIQQENKHRVPEWYSIDHEPFIAFE